MKHHLAKQLPNNKQITIVNECGRKGGVHGSVRTLTLDRFKKSENKCKQCLESAIKKGKITLPVS